MKRLYLIRHAKSSWDHPGMSDFDRPLNQRGEGDLPAAAERLRERHFQPGHLVTSTAVRARSTATGLIRDCGLPLSLIREEQDLYLADIDTWLRIIRQGPDAHGEIAGCGHNPGITTLVEILSDESIGNLPTCGIACIEFDLTSWKDVAPGQGRLAWLDFPKNHS